MKTYHASALAIALASTAFISSAASAQSGSFRVEANSTQTTAISVCNPIVDVTLTGDGDTDLDFEIFDSTGNMVHSDYDMTDFTAARLFRRQGVQCEDFQVRTANLGNVWNQLAVDVTTVQADPTQQANNNSGGSGTSAGIGALLGGLIRGLAGGGNTQNSGSNFNGGTPSKPTGGTNTGNFAAGNANAGTQTAAPINRTAQPINRNAGLANRGVGTANGPNRGGTSAIGTPSRGTTRGQGRATAFNSNGLVLAGTDQFQIFGNEVDFAVPITVCEPQMFFEITGSGNTDLDYVVEDASGNVVHADSGLSDATAFFLDGGRRGTCMSYDLFVNNLQNQSNTMFVDTYSDPSQTRRATINQRPQVNQPGSAISGDGLNREVTLQNNSGQNIRALFWANSGRNDWGNDQLQGAFFGNGQQWAATIDDGSRACRFDFRAQLQNGQTIDRMNVDVCATFFVTFNF